MATTFGRQPEDVLQDPRGNALVGVTIELYGSYADATARTGMVASVVTGELGRWSFVDPTNRTRLYGRDPGGNVWSLEAEEASDAEPITGLAGLPAGSVFTIYWNGSAWVYGGATITARPSARTDLTMLAIGGGSGPGFGVVGVDLWLRDAS